MLIKILIGIAVVIVIFVAVVATRPSDFKVTRSAVLPAPPATVFGEVNDLHKWDAWSPWAKLDPNFKITFDGPQAAAGSSMHWAGNAQVGEGKMTITDSKPNEQILMQLVFIKPFAGESSTEFTFKPENGGTLVTWTMSGKNNFVGKCFSLFVDCDKMMGGQFEQGLDNMKKVVSTTTP